MYSHIINGKVLNFHFKTREQGTVFYIGDIFIGTLYFMHNKWSAVSWYENPYGVDNGFKTRLDAAEFLLNVFNAYKKRGLSNA